LAKSLNKKLFIVLASAFLLKFWVALSETLTHLQYVAGFHKSVRATR
jgi:hypothetical protein